MYWNDLDGSVLLGKVFSEPVEISNIDVFDIKIDREGKTVIISFDLVNQLPDNPPPKWPQGYNRCRCGINCSGVSELSIAGISVDMPAKINITKLNDYIEIIIAGPDLHLSMKCSHIHFMGPTVYISH